MLDPIASDRLAYIVCKFKPSLVLDLNIGSSNETTKTLKWLVLEQVYSVKPRPVPSSPQTTLPTFAETSTRPASPIAQSPSGRRLFNFWSVSRTPSTSSTSSQTTKKTLKIPKVGEMGEPIEEDEVKKDAVKVKFPGSKRFTFLVSRNRLERSRLMQPAQRFQLPFQPTLMPKLCRLLWSL